MNHYIPCPICKRILQPAGNVNTLVCGQRKVYVEELNTHIDTIHAMYCVNEDGTIPLKVIEVPPYAFEIQQIPERGFFQTRLQKVISPAKTRRGNKTLDRETLLVLP